MLAHYTAACPSACCYTAMQKVILAVTRDCKLKHI